MNFRRREIALFSAFAGCLVASCGSSSDCEETRTCGSSASGGASGAATGGTGGTGTGGTAGVAASGGSSSGTGGVGATGGTSPECVINTDCSDGLQCNGVETCEDGSCQQGTPVVCTNPDAAHCDTSCVEGDGGSTCATLGKDADADGYTDAACPQPAGANTDCDDTQKSVHPGASDVCDGLDNDCDGLDDFEEGSTLAGNADDFIAGTFDARNPAIAWSSAKQYGVVWYDYRDGNPEIYFARMTPDGKKVGTASDEIRISNHSNDSFAPRVAWGNGVYGIVWQDPHGAATNQTYFRSIDTMGNTKSLELKVSDGGVNAQTPDIAAFGTGWVVVWSDRRSNGNGEIYIRLLKADGSPDASEKPIVSQTGVNLMPRVAVVGSEIIVTWSHRPDTTSATPNVIKAVRLDASLSSKGEQVVSTNPPPTNGGAASSAVTATASGWSVAWEGYVPTQIGYTELTLAGTPGCSATGISAPNMVGPLAIAARGAARLVAYREGIASAQVKAVRYKGGCASAKTLSFAGTYDVVENANVEVAWGDSSAIVVWNDRPGSAAYKIRRWAAGPNLCDAPKP